MVVDISDTWARIWSIISQIFDVNENMRTLVLRWAVRFVTSCNIETIGQSHWSANIYFAAANILMLRTFSKFELLHIYQCKHVGFCILITVDATNKSMFSIYGNVLGKSVVKVKNI